MTYLIKILISGVLALAGAFLATSLFDSTSTTVSAPATTLPQTEVPDEATKTFIETHTPSAVAVGGEWGIPPSVLLACALQTYGFDDTGKFGDNNAWFLLEPKDNWEGETFEMGNIKLRRYDTALESFSDFAKMLSERPEAYTKTKTWWEILKSDGYDAEDLAKQYNLTSIDK